MIDKRMSIGHDADGTESYSYYAIFKLFDEGDYGNGYTKKKYIHEAEYNCLTIDKVQSALVFKCPLFGLSLRKIFGKNVVLKEESAEGKGK